LRVSGDLKVKEGHEICERVSKNVRSRTSRLEYLIIEQILFSL
jgi:divalent metal cation (Fe/Co/Zn/Cd) transporter